MKRSTGLKISDQTASALLARDLAHGDLWRAARIRALPLFNVAVDGAEALR